VKQLCGDDERKKAVHMTAKHVGACLAMFVDCSTSRMKKIALKRAEELQH
jgi:hypothetical protein